MGQQFCSKCGEPIQGNNKFCPMCGNAIYQLEDNFESENQIPKFSSPKQDIPKFNSPNQERDIPKFNSPNQESDIPRFNSPNSNQIPTFSSSNNNINITSSNFKSCSYHKENVAVTKCKSCGKLMCEQCTEVFTGDICYNCACMNVEENVQIGISMRNQVIKRIIIGVIGAVVCGILASTSFFNKVFSSTEDAGIYKFLFVLFGASLYVYVPIFGKIFKYIKRFLMWKPIDHGLLKEILSCFKYCVLIFSLGLFVFMFSFFMVVSPFVATTLAIIDGVKLYKAVKLIERNKEILHNMADYMEYIKLHPEENVNSDVLANDSRMQNNRFAQSVIRNGFANANQNIMNDAREFAENERQIKKYVLNEYGEAVRA